MGFFGIHVHLQLTKTKIFYSFSSSLSLIQLNQSFFQSFFPGERQYIYCCLQFQCAFLARQCASFRNQILNFRVMAVRDTDYDRVYRKIYTYFKIYDLFRSKSIRKRVNVNTSLFSTDNQPPRQILDVNTIFGIGVPRRYFFLYFLLFSFVIMYHGGTPIWRFHSGLCKFQRNIATNI